VLISERLSPLHIPSPAPQSDRPVRWDVLDDVVDVIRRLDAGVARRLRAACRRRVVIARCRDAAPVRAVLALLWSSVAMTLAVVMATSEMRRRL
jgi:hypothetical protein